MESMEPVLPVSPRKASEQVLVEEMVVRNMCGLPIPHREEVLLLPSRQVLWTSRQLDILLPRVWDEEKLLFPTY